MPLLKRKLSGCCRSVRTATLLLAQLFTLAAMPASAEYGKPFLQAFLPSEYEGHQQNWDITQGDDGIMYIANSAGVLAFDGSRWQLIKSEAAQPFFSVHADGDGQVYAGTIGDLGILRRSHRGEHEFASLLDRATSRLNLSRVRAIESTADAVYFLSVEHLLRLDTRTPDGKLTVWVAAELGQDPKSTPQFRHLWIDGDRVFVAATGKGILELVDGRLELVPGSEVLAEVHVRGVAAHSAGTILATFDGELYLQDGSTFRVLAQPPGQPQLEDKFAGLTTLRSGEFALSTLGNGLLVIDAQGRIERRIDIRSGLPDNSVFNSGYTDLDGGLWLPLNTGIARVELNGPLEYFDADLGITGAVVDLARHQDKLYAASTQGLFRFEPDHTGQAGRWKKLDGLPTFCWTLLSSGSRLIVAASEGLWVIDEDRAPVGVDIGVQTRALFEDPASGTVYVTTIGRGLIPLEIDSGTLRSDTLRLGPPVEGLPDNLRDIVAGPEQDLWLVSSPPNRKEKIVRIRRDSQGNLGESRLYGSDSGLPESVVLKPFIWRDRLYVAAGKNGLLAYDADSDSFSPPEETELRTISADGIERGIVDPTGSLWVAPITGAAVRIEELDSGALTTSTPIVRAGIYTHTTFFSEQGRLWAADGNGTLVLYRSELDSALPMPKVLLGATFSGLKDDDATTRRSADSGARIEVPFGQRSVRFQYALPSFDSPESTEFQSRLSGLDGSWSTWSEETYRDYPGLREGTYRFELRARDVRGRIAQADTLSFRVAPPWFRTSWFYTLLLVLTAALVWGVISLRQKTAKARLQELRTEVEERRRVEAALIDNQRLLFQAQRLSQLGSWKWHIDEHRFDGSPEYRRIYGLEATEEITLEKINARIHPDDREKVKRSWRRAFDGTRQTVEYRILTAAGEIREIYADGELVEEKDGETTRMAGIAQDVTERKATQAALQASDERYRTFVRNSIEGMVRFELENPISISQCVNQQVDALYRDATVAECNQAFSQMYGYAQAEELLGARVVDFSVPPDGIARSWVEEFVSADYMFSGEVTERDHLGQTREFQRTVTGIVEDGLLLRVWSTQRDIAERKRQERRLSYLANFDMQTGLPNRFLFEDRMAQGLNHAERTGVQLAVHYIDLDNFKNVNDTLGHSVGDELLKAVGERLQKLLRSTDTVARLGGDEFAILQEGVHDGEASAGALATKVIDSLSAPFLLSGHEIHSGGSVGITLSETDSESEDLMTQADTALHKSKESGRGVYSFYTAEMAREVQVYVDLTQDLRRALSEHELIVEYQPQVRLSDGRCIGSEALVRWLHPQHGRLLPGAFIGVAENSGLIAPIGLWVLEEACRQVRQWHQEGLEPPAVSVNLSAVQFKQPQLAQNILEIIERTGLPPEQLELEITETTLMDSREAVTRTMTELRNRGVRFAIDDFGTGYSSLQYVSSLPVSRLKIAMEFVRGLGTTGHHRAIIDAIIRLGEALEIEVLAEGVETDEQARLLRESGCHLVQGFGFSRPLSAIAMHKWMAEDRDRPFVAQTI